MRVTKAQAEAWGIGKFYREKAREKDGQEGRDKLFDAACKAHGLPLPVHEFQFHPERKWRLDYVWEGWLALEVEGFGLNGEIGRHRRIAGFLKDMEKYNEAAIMGYIILRCTTKDVESGAAFELVKRALVFWEG